MNLRPGSTVYLDTNAWNATLDWVAGRSFKWLAGPVYLFSSCNLDEFSLAPSNRAKDLAAIAWRISNRKKLLDHVELTAAEIAAHRRGIPVDYYDGRDRNFFTAWSAMRSGGVDDQMRDGMRAMLDRAKREYRDHLQGTRDALGPFFRTAADRGLTREWSDLLEEMASESDIRDMLIRSLEEPGLGPQGANIAALEGMDYRLLPGTASGVQYHLALSFLAAQRLGKLTRPDYGDQVDFRHAYYGGVADVFVTGDGRMHEILSTMVPACTARVLTCDEYLGLAVS